MSYVEMLDAEIEASEQFTKENFGLKVGDGFPELVREVAKSEKIGMRLFLGLILGSLSGKAVADDLKESTAEKKPDFGPMILKNAGAFDVPLSMLYWGIQVGRKIERESTDALRSLEK